MVAVRRPQGYGGGGDGGVGGGSVFAVLCYSGGGRAGWREYLDWGRGNGENGWATYWW